MKGPFSNPSWDGASLHHLGPPRLNFSRTEVLHLVGAVAVLSYAFALLLDDKPETLLSNGGDVWAALLPQPDALLGAFLAVASGFVLHELSHKVVAQRYGHWAEFRASFQGLGLSALVAAAVGFLFAAPGAVLIQGRVTPRENGIISLVGPATNLLVAIACLPFFAFQVQESFATRLLGTVTFVNAVLAIFNLLPLGPLDGRKVWHWSRAAYITAVALSLGVLLVAMMQGAVP